MQIEVQNLLGNIMRIKTNLVNEYDVYYCYERGCNDNDIFMCASLGPCAVWGGGGCTTKSLGNQTRLRDFFDGVYDEYIKPVSKEKVKSKKSLFKKLLGMIIWK